MIFFNTIKIKTYKYFERNDFMIARYYYNDKELELKKLVEKILKDYLENYV